MVLDRLCRLIQRWKVGGTDPVTSGPSAESGPPQKVSSLRMQQILGRGQRAGW